MSLHRVIRKYGGSAKKDTNGKLLFAKEAMEPVAHIATIKN